MYIYELPFHVNRDLCRLLDNDNNWKLLAGKYMKYSTFEINEMEQIARRQASSPTAELLTRWGQQNHRVGELFILLHMMEHLPALHCLVDVVDEKYRRLLNRNRVRNGDRRPASFDVNGNQQTPNTNSDSSQAMIPRLGVLVADGSTSQEDMVISPPNSSNNDSSMLTSSQDSRSACDGASDPIIKHISSIPKLRYEDLKEATDGWSDNNILGKGGFGRVYKGEWMLLTVAVKRLENNDGKNRDLIGEMCLNQYRHDNILPLYGYSLGGPEACLVYQLMAGGSLEQRLRCKTNKPPLSWPQRHHIAHGVARGLQFLHTMSGTPLVHGDIKPANILLDQCDTPKIGDFGLARKGPNGEVTHWTVSKVFGTGPYLPEEYIRSRSLSPAVDVFSYGVVLMEVATALRPLDNARPNKMLADHIHALAQDGVDLATLEDRQLSGAASRPALCREVMSLGIQCTASSRRQRLTMLQAYRRLDAMNMARS